VWALREKQTLTGWTKVLRESNPSFSSLPDLLYLCAMARKIIFYENHFIDFYQKQDQGVKRKIQYVLELVKQVERVPEKFLKHLTGTQGLYEIRVEYQSSIYRIFCCFDEGQVVILFNGFQKKTAKTPQVALEKAALLMKEYFTKKRLNT
jgi:phage-related protein